MNKSIWMDLNVFYIYGVNVHRSSVTVQHIYLITYGEWRNHLQKHYTIAYQLMLVEVCSVFKGQPDPIVVKC